MSNCEKNGPHSSSQWISILFPLVGNRGCSKELPAVNTAKVSILKEREKEKKGSFLIHMGKRWRIRAGGSQPWDNVCRCNFSSKFAVALSWSSLFAFTIFFSGRATGFPKTLNLCPLLFTWPGPTRRPPRERNWFPSWNKIRLGCFVFPGRTCLCDFSASPCLLYSKRRVPTTRSVFHVTRRQFNAIEGKAGGEKINKIKYYTLSNMGMSNGADAIETSRRPWSQWQGECVREGALTSIIQE